MIRSDQRALLILNSIISIIISVSKIESILYP
jgi:hypothetical protein